MRLLLASPVEVPVISGPGPDSTAFADELATGAALLEAAEPDGAANPLVALTATDDVGTASFAEVSTNEGNEEAALEPMVMYCVEQLLVDETVTYCTEQELELPYGDESALVAIGLTGAVPMGAVPIGMALEGARV